MILLDYSGIAVAAIFSQDRPEEIQEGLIRHMILNTIRRYNVQHRDKFGKMVIACDAHSWRKDYFKNYKAKRKTTREESPLDWKEFFRLINMVREELEEHMPYPVIYAESAEADDVIGVLTKETQDFGKDEPVLIISPDKDFLQLHKFKNVKQFSPMKRDFITVEDPQKYLFEHICKGDTSDGVPNVLSGDDVFVEGIRQTPMRKKKIEDWYECRWELDLNMSDEENRNFVRNQKLIDLAYTPQEIADDIVKQFNEQKEKPNNKILNYLIVKRCSMLVEAAADFQTK
tara:strand:+ start:19278 stop:20138 length:861 start_codon:yes stop_codon:yes gene_type:complete